MKKIVLASAFAFAALTAGAQSLTPSTAERSEDAANLIITMNLHNWIDIDNEFTSLLSSEPNSWNDLNNGWIVGSAPFNLSATRRVIVRAQSTSFREQTGAHATSDMPGWFFGPQYVCMSSFSNSANIPQTVTSPTFDDAWIHATSLATNTQVYSSDEGMYLRRLNPVIGAFLHSPNGTYYSLNLNGGTYRGTVTFTATLN